MQIKSLNRFGAGIVWFALAVAFGAFVVGCHGADDNAPTNTKNSQYIGNGQTAADKIGAQRAAAHRPRLNGAGATQ